MDHDQPDDHYAVLGIPPTVGAAEIRRAYRLLALRHHPDRAGEDATARFQRIAEAYRVLSNTDARAAFDAQRAAAARHAAEIAWGSASLLARALRGGPGTLSGSRSNLIARLCGPLEALIERGVAGRHADGGVELFLTAQEARDGGTVALLMAINGPCPTCGGVARAGHVWCRRCEFAGTVLEEVAVRIDVPRQTPDGRTFLLAVDRLGLAPPLRVRLRLRA